MRHNTSTTTTSSTTGTTDAAPVVAAAQHLLQPNGSICGSHVAAVLKPLFPHFLAALPHGTQPALFSSSSSNSSSPINGNDNDSSAPDDDMIEKEENDNNLPTTTTRTKKPMTRNQIRELIVEIGPVLASTLPADAWHFSVSSLSSCSSASQHGNHHHPPLPRQQRRRRHVRVAVVLPNGPELAMAIMAVSIWAICVPLNAFAAPQELKSDLQTAQCHFIIGMKHADSHAVTATTTTASSSAASNIAFTLAQELNIPFVALQPDPEYAGKFSLVPPATTTTTVDKHTEVETKNGAPLLVMAGKNVTPQPTTTSTTPAVTTSVTTNEEDVTTTTTEIDHDTNSPSSNNTNGRLSSSSSPSPPLLEPNSYEDIMLLLFTSGTTGEKKLVPHTWSNVLVAAACIAISWQLSPDDINCNLMPLFHVGGILRQVFSPILSGGAVICCPSFDPSLFWQLLRHGVPSIRINRTEDDDDDKKKKKKKDTVVWDGSVSFTWYYAAPTMHHLILETGRMEGYLSSSSSSSSTATPSSSAAGNGTTATSPGTGVGPHATLHPSSSFSSPGIRMIANAAGGLSPSLARELRHAFRAHVLPSYGMTECMPMSSPPAQYQLEKPGTSGVAVGPEIAIFTSSLQQRQQLPATPGTEGPICVRGKPLFPGYYYPNNHNNDNNTNDQEEDARIDTSCFVQDQHAANHPSGKEDNPNNDPNNGHDGWFNTGDIGYMDAEGYLYITGRSKEVINRGGEIISPLEVEEACMAHPDVATAVAFSAQHAVLQEVVGVLIVPRFSQDEDDDENDNDGSNNNNGSPNEEKRLRQRRPIPIDLPALHAFLGQGRLAAPKWPQCLVYMMEGVPKSHTNKLLRVKLGERFKLPIIHDNMYPIERTFRAHCPPVGTPLSVAIPCQRVTVDPIAVQTTLRQELIPHSTTTNTGDETKVANAKKESASSLALTSSAPAPPELVVTPHPDKLGHLVVYAYNLDRLDVIRTAQTVLDAYLMPSHVCSLPAPVAQSELGQPPQPSDAVMSIIQEAESFGQGPTDPLISTLQEEFQVQLQLDCLPTPDSNFFHLGGSSMMASQLASKIRKIHHVPFGGAEVFHYPSCTVIADLIRERQQEQELFLQQQQQLRDRNGTETGSDASSTTAAGNSNANPFTTSTTKDKASLAASSLFAQNLNLEGTKLDPTRLDLEPNWTVFLFQLFPLFVLRPTWQMTRVFCFCRMLFMVRRTLATALGSKNNHVCVFFVTLLSFHFLWSLITPLFFVVVKWTVIGKYQAGRYPIWGQYYLRWWLVDILRKMIGHGFFGNNAALLRQYYIWLGATIGPQTSISTLAEIAEYDLVHLGSGVAVDYATVRGFTVDNGCMLLGPVTVGNQASVGIRSVVAPFTTIPDHAHLSPNATSYEINIVGGDDMQQRQHLQYNRQAMPEPNWWYTNLVVNPILVAVQMVSQLPALAVFLYMFQHGRTAMTARHDPFQSLPDLVLWLCNPRRFPYFFAIRFTRAVAAPVVYMLCAVLVKRLVIGPFQAGPRDTKSQWQRCRHALAAKLFTREKMNEFSELVGRHYEMVSILFRCLGAKVGKRVFWPGHLPVFTGEFDLLEVGDDVVFGSRSAIVCSTKDSCEKVRLCSGSNMCDNTVVLPGAVLGKNVVLGSNAVCPMQRYLPEGSIWFGARSGEPVMLGKGTENATDSMNSTKVPDHKFQMKGDESTLRPFGRAFYMRDAPYLVCPIPLLILYTILTKLFITCVQTLPLIWVQSLPIIRTLYLSSASVSSASWSLFGFGIPFVGPANGDVLSLRHVFMILVLTNIVANAILVMCWLVIEVAGKWIFMGRRKEGVFNWDRSSYPQNWEFYQLLTRIRSMGKTNTLDYISGTPFMALFFRLLGGKVGSHCCLYPSRSDLIMPEPDLVEIGDRVVLDNAHVVTHLNTHGNFEFKKIIIESNVTLRNQSRAQQGVRMETGSMLFEKALVLTGEIVEADSIWIGAPASRLSSYDTSSLGSRLSMQQPDVAPPSPSKQRLDRLSSTFAQRGSCSDDDVDEKKNDEGLELPTMQVKQVTLRRRKNNGGERYDPKYGL